MGAPPLVNEGVQRGAGGVFPPGSDDGAPRGLAEKPGRPLFRFRPTYLRPVCKEGQ